MTDAPPFRRTKIVATLGPASAQADLLRRLIGAGVDVIRINSSHGSSEDWAQWIAWARDAGAELDKHVGVLVDLQGPRIRVGALPAPRALAAGSEIVFAPESRARPDEIPTTYEALADDVHPGSRVLLDEGLIVTEVEKVRGDRVHAVVVYGGELRSNKGMNLPGVQVSAPAVTDRDRESLGAALAAGADFIGVSFVRRAEDILEVRRLVPPGVHLVAKIEKAAAVSDLPRILEATDVLMVARGDLGVELPFEEVPLTQKRLIAMANEMARPVITATQMLESMVRNPRPTRAEASDVANAILDGTDAVMLSAETAVGAYPVEAVEAMARIINEIERAARGLRVPRRRRTDALERSEIRADEAIASATSVAADMLRVPAIVCFTKSGFTARTVSAHRPQPPIIGLSTEPETCRYLSIVWGVLPLLSADSPSYDAMLGSAREHLLRRQVVRPGDLLVVTAGVPFEVKGTTNLLKVETV